MFYVFCEGEAVLKKFQKKYITHSRGLFIFAPSGSGKTYFVNHQKKKDWIDGDEIWTATKAQPNSSWWTEGIEAMNDVDKRCDIITDQARKAGLWIMGASNNWLVPDAIVLPDWETNKKYIREREKNNYDGGAKSDDFKQVLAHRKFMREHARKNGVLIFKTIEEAVSKLTKNL